VFFILTVVCFSSGFGGGYGGYRGGGGGYENRSGGGGGRRGGHRPIPDEAPFTAYIGNLPTGIVQGDVEQIFSSLSVNHIHTNKNPHNRSLDCVFYWKCFVVQHLDCTLS